MRKVKLFQSAFEEDLEKLVNEFIQNKTIISISYSPVSVGSTFVSCICIQYEE